MLSNFSRTSRLESVLKTLKASSYMVVLCCLDQNFSFVLSLFVKILKVFFVDLEKLTRLLMIPQLDLKNVSPHCSLSEVSLAFLINIVAQKGIPTDAEILLELCPAFHRLCENFPPQLVTPLESACIAHNKNMVNYFLGKVSVQKERLIAGCLLDNLIDESIHERVEMIEMVIGDEKELIIHESFFSYLRQKIVSAFSSCVLHRYLMKHHISLKNIRREDKELLLKCALCGSDDYGFCNMLLALFKKDAGESSRYIDMFSGFTSEKILDSINLIDARDTFSCLLLDVTYAAEALRSVETLKILMEICSYFAPRNTEHYSYLHLAVRHYNLEWVKYLISIKVPSDAIDIQGNTPLHLVAKCCFLQFEFTRILIENGADIRKKNFKSENAAHIFMQCNDSYISGSGGWIQYTLDNGYADIWTAKDCNGNTPFELLQSVQRDPYGAKQHWIDLIQQRIDGMEV